MKSILQKQKASFKLTSFKALEKKYYSKRGTAKREAYETALKKELIGELSGKSVKTESGGTSGEIKRTNE